VLGVLAMPDFPDHNKERFEKLQAEILRLQKENKRWRMISGVLALLSFILGILHFIV
jgi:hypothetical protein